MKQWVKVLLLVLGMLALLALAVVSYANYVLTGVVKEELNDQMELLEGRQLRYDDIELDIWSGSVTVRGLYYSSSVEPTLPDSVAGFEISLPLVRMRYMNLLRMLRKRELYVRQIRIDDMKLVGHIPEAWDSLRASEINIKTSQTFLEAIASMDVNQVQLRNASVHISRQGSPFLLNADGIYISAHNLGYNFVDSVLTYNDSIYEISIGNVYQRVGDYECTVGSFYTKDAQEVLLQDFRSRCIVPKHQLAKHIGKRPALWSSCSLREIRTNRCNLIRSVLQGDFTLDTVYVEGETVELFRDKMYPPTEVYRPIQTMMMQLDRPIFIKHLRMTLPSLAFTLREATGREGNVSFLDMDLRVDRISNRRGNHMQAGVKGRLGNQGGRVHARFDLVMNSTCDWTGKVGMYSANMQAFNSFVMPLYGLELAGHIDTLQAVYGGDSLRSEGRMRMIYEDMQVGLRPDSPMKGVGKHAKTLTAIVKGLITHANPPAPGKVPNAFWIKGQRDLYDMYPLSFIVALVDGIAKNVLTPFNLANKLKPAELEEFIRELKK